jgi:hypothetical protein
LIQIMAPGCANAILSCKGPVSQRPQGQSMAFVFYHHPRRPNEVSATIGGSELAIRASVECLEREDNEVTAIIPPPTTVILQGKSPPKAVTAK